MRRKGEQRRKDKAMKKEGKEELQHEKKRRGKENKKKRTKNCEDKQMEEEKKERNRFFLQTKETRQIKRKTVKEKVFHLFVFSSFHLFIFIFLFLTYLGFSLRNAKGELSPQTSTIGSIAFIISSSSISGSISATTCGIKSRRLQRKIRKKIN